MQSFRSSKNPTRDRSLQPRHASGIPVRLLSLLTCAALSELICAASETVSPS